MRSFRLYLFEPKPTPARPAAELDPEVRAVSQAAASRMVMLYKRHRRSFGWLLLGGASGIVLINHCKVSASPLLGPAFLMWCGALIYSAARISDLYCPCCKNDLTAFSARYCPSCGAGPEARIPQPQRCPACGTRFFRGHKRQRAYRIRWYPHCALFLDEEGI